VKNNKKAVDKIMKEAGQRVKEEEALKKDIVSIAKKLESAGPVGMIVENRSRVTQISADKTLFLKAMYFFSFLLSS